MDPGVHRKLRGLLDVRARDGEVGDRDDDRYGEHDRGGAVSEVDPAQAVGFADVVGEGRTQRPCDDVGHPEGGDAVQTKLPSRETWDQVTTAKRMPEVR